MKLNWFSPVPPTPSSIAFDTAAILPALSKAAEISLWVHEPNWSPELEQHARVIPYQWQNVPWPEINRADATIFHIGNHAPFHGPLWLVNRQHPGIIMLHDFCLQNFFAGMLEQSAGFGASDYRAMMEFYYPERGGWIADGVIRGAIECNQIREECPLTGAVLENATGVIVHTPNGCAALRQSTDLPVNYVPLFIPPRAQDNLPGETKPGHRDIYRIIMFGFLTTNRRVGSVLKVLADLPQKDRFRVDIYGTVEDEDSIRRMIETGGLNDIVKLHGFVPEAQLAAALARSDLAINLRDPTMGEASSSQLRIWQNGLPGLVTDTGWYSTLPRDSVAFVRRYAELDDIEMHLTSFLRDPEPYRVLGRNGLRHVQQHHTMESYVHALLAAVEKTLRNPQPAMVRRMTHRAGQAMRPWFAPDAADVLTRSSATAIGHLINDPAAWARRETAGAATPTPG